MPSMLAGNVYRGIARLLQEDSEFFLKIDPEYFSIASVRDCAVGQFFKKDFGYDPYRKGLRRLEIDETDGFLYGFDVHDDYHETIDWDKLQYRIKVLNRMWRYALNEMRDRNACMKRHPSYKG